MSKTKFIKVSVEERLPEKDGRYFIWVDNPNARHLNSKNLSEEYNMERNFFKNGSFQTFYETTHFLLEVPDREEEMREMLERIVKEHNSDARSWSTILEIKELLNK